MNREVVGTGQQHQATYIPASTSEVGNPSTVGAEPTPLSLIRTPIVLPILHLKI